MIVYLDTDYIVHTQQDENSTLTPWVDSESFFTGKCAAYIEGYRVIPEGAVWEREDGQIYSGLMISPVINPTELIAIQAEADRQTITDLDSAVVDLTYQNILLELGV